MSAGSRLAASLFCLSWLVCAQTPAQLEIFEKNARPLFAEKCQVCHNAEAEERRSGSQLNGRHHDASATGFFGTAAEPEKSAILQALGYEGRIKMPPAGQAAARKNCRCRGMGRGRRSRSLAAPFPPPRPSIQAPVFVPSPFAA